MANAGRLRCLTETSIKVLRTSYIRNPEPEANYCTDWRAFKGQKAFAIKTCYQHKKRTICCQMIRIVSYLLFLFYTETMQKPGTSAYTGTDADARPLCRPPLFPAGTSAAVFCFPIKKERLWIRHHPLLATWPYSVSFCPCHFLSNAYWHVTHCKQ